MLPKLVFTFQTNRMSFAFSEDILSEAGVLTQPPPGDTPRMDDSELQTCAYSQAHPRFSQELRDSGYSQHGSQDGWAVPGARRTLPRPPTWPSLPRERSVGQRTNTRWKFSRGNVEMDESSSAAAGRERDLRHHLSVISSQVTKLPAHVSKLLEEAVRFLVIGQDQRKEVIQDKIVDVGSAIEEIEKTKRCEGIKRMEQLNNLEKIMKTISLEMNKLTMSSGEVLATLRHVSADLEEIKGGLYQHSELINKLSEEVKVIRHNRLVGSVASKDHSTSPLDLEAVPRCNVRRFDLGHRPWEAGHWGVKDEVDHQVPQAEDREISIFGDESDEEETEYKPRSLLVLHLDSDLDSD